MPETRRFESLTETPGTPVSRQGAAMILSRYHYAASLCAGKRVLEIACGTGIGLGLLTQQASRVVGGDIELRLLRRGRAHYGGRAPLLQLSAEALPFREGTFDVVLLFEAAYYVHDMDRALDEIYRVLSQRGTAVIVSANPERPDFIPSPHAVRYHTASQFRREFELRGFEVLVEGAFRLENGVVAGVLRVARKIVTRVRLVPGSLRARAVLKRILFGKLVRLPAELAPGSGNATARCGIPPAPSSRFKVLYVTARRSGGAHPRPPEPDSGATRQDGLRQQPSSSATIRLPR